MSLMKDTHHNSVLEEARLKQRVNQAGMTLDEANQWKYSDNTFASHIATT